jgi:hypothetical protein
MSDDPEKSLEAEIGPDARQISYWLGRLEQNPSQKLLNDFK